MLCGKFLVRSLVVGGVLGGTALLVAGPDRLGAVASQARDSVNSAIDAHIDDPVALRAQLRALMGQYPEKIAEVRGDLAELQAQSSQLARELEVSRRVVALAETDFGQIQSLIARAEAAQGAAEGAVVQVVFSNEPLDMTAAYAKATHIGEVVNTYGQRAADIERDMGYLQQQESRLGELLAQLEREQNEFQTQIFQLDRQIDAIARNDRMIEVMAERQETIDEHSRYSAASLDQLTARLADIRAKQEAQLDSLGKTQTNANYENRAKYELDAKTRYHRTVGKPAPLAPAQTPVIKIGPTSDPVPATPGPNAADASVPAAKPSSIG